MALNNTQADVVGQAIADSILAMTEDDKKNVPLIWKKVMREIYAGIVRDAVVSANVTVTSVTGVTAGGGISGPGSGTAAGNLS